MRNFIMSRKEIEQVKIFERIKNGEITRKEGALSLNMTYRWIKKKYKRYEEKGEEVGLLHGNRGKVSIHRIKDDILGKIEELILNGLEDAGPTFIAYKFEEIYQVKISKETIRKLMIRKGFWQGKPKKIVHRKRRERRTNIGMLTQLDGSYHAWFENRSEKCFLLVFIDDATSEILWLEFAKSESTFALMQATKNYLKKRGRPLAFYTDFASVYHVHLNNKDGYKKTQYQRALKELDIDLIHAHSPQAKGRVERVHQTLQDRLIKEMRLRNISTIHEANRYVQEVYMHAHNKLFAQKPAGLADLHKSVQDYNLHSIFTIQQTRILQNDFIVTYKKHLFQIEKQQKITVKPKDNITIMNLLDGSFSLLKNGTILTFKEITTRPQQLPKEKIILDKIPHKPSPNHPWRTYSQPITVTRVG